MRMMIVTAMAAVVLLCARTEAMDVRKSSRPEVVAHRGSSAEAPENTLAAFRKAREDRARWFELDCSLSADGEVVVIHDGTVDRTTNGSGTVDQMTFAELRTIDAGSWKSTEFADERIPTLGEALDLARRGFGVYIEIKDRYGDKGLAERLADITQGRPMRDPALRRELLKAAEDFGTPNLDLARKVVRDVRARKAEKRVVVQSFSPVLCVLVRAEAPELRVELLASDGLETAEGWDRAVLICERFGFHGLNPNHKHLTPERIAGLHARGLTTAAYTVDDPVRMAELAAMRVDRIITNLPALCRETLRSH
jgi:glycerophosphoryl diester phosphodiesterase